VSIRKVCAALEFDRSTYHYKSRRSGQASQLSADHALQHLLVEREIRHQLMSWALALCSSSSVPHPTAIQN
jgi:hypothetical protein